MTNQPSLPIFERDTTITSSKLRRIGYVPATIYGPQQEPVSIQLQAHDLQLAIAKGIRKFKLEGMGKTFDVKVQQIQKVNTSDALMHIEFLVPGQNN